MPKQSAHTATSAPRKQKTPKAQAAPEPTSEARILQVARDVFHARGFDGATMQEIANAAGINKALLHYYYRSKDKLFEAVFRDTVSKIFPFIAQALMTDEPFEQKIRAVVAAYIDLLLANPAMPGFMLHELSQRPERLKAFFDRQLAAPEALQKFAADMGQAVAAGRIKPVDPRQFIVSILGMCVFPFVAKPVVMAIFRFSDDDFADFARARKAHIAEMALAALQTDNQREQLFHYQDSSKRGQP